RRRPARGLLGGDPDARACALTQLPQLGRSEFYFRGVFFTSDAQSRFERAEANVVTTCPIEFGWTRPDTPCRRERCTCGTLRYARTGRCTRTGVWCAPFVMAPRSNRRRLRTSVNSM